MTEIELEGGREKFIIGLIEQVDQSGIREEIEKLLKIGYFYKGKDGEREIHLSDAAIMEIGALVCQCFLKVEEDVKKRLLETGVIRIIDDEVHVRSDVIEHGIENVQEILTRRYFSN